MAICPMGYPNAVTTSFGAWRYVPLLSSIGVYAAGALTFGVGFLAFPVAVVLTVLAFRRTAPPRGFVFWLGSVASAVVSAAGAVALAVVIAVLVSDLSPIALFCPLVCPTQLVLSRPGCDLRFDQRARTHVRRTSSRNSRSPRRSCRWP